MKIAVTGKGGVGKSPYDCSPELVKEVKDIIQRMGGENL